MGGILLDVIGLVFPDSATKCPCFRGTFLLWRAQIYHSARPCPLRKQVVLNKAEAGTSERQADFR